MAARKQRHVVVEIHIGCPKPCKPEETAGKPRANLAPVMINGRMLSL